MSEILASVIIRRLSESRELQTGENKTSFRNVQGRIDLIFTLCQLLEWSQTYHCSKTVEFHDLWVVFDSVNRGVLCLCLSLKGVSQTCINLYSNTTGRVRVYGKLSRELSVSSVVSLGCSIPFFFIRFCHRYHPGSYIFFI